MRRRWARLMAQPPPGPPTMDGQAAGPSTACAPGFAVVGRGMLQRALGGPGPVGGAPCPGPAPQSLAPQQKPAAHAHPAGCVARKLASAGTMVAAPANLGNFKVFCYP